MFGFADVSTASSVDRLHFVKVWKVLKCGLNVERFGHYYLARGRNLRKRVIVQDRLTDKGLGRCIAFIAPFSFFLLSPCLYPCRWTAHFFCREYSGGFCRLGFSGQKPKEKK